MQLSVTTKTVEGTSAAVGWAGERTVTIDRPVTAGGSGLGYSGGELLFLAVAACVHNDIFREAALKSITVHEVEVTVSGDFGGSPVIASNVEYRVQVRADASAEEIAELIRHTDSVAEIPNSLRLGANVRLVEG